MEFRRVLFRSVYNYIAERNASAAMVVVAYIRQAVTLLTDHPHLGRITDEKGVRMLVVPRFPYVVFYKVHREEVFILSIMHAAQEH